MFSTRGAFSFFRSVYRLEPKDDKVLMRDWAKCILRGGERKHLALGWDFSYQNRRGDNNSTESVTCDARVPAAVKKSLFFWLCCNAFSKKKFEDGWCPLTVALWLLSVAVCQKGWKRVEFTASRAADAANVWTVLIITSPWSILLWGENGCSNQF